MDFAVVKVNGKQHLVSKDSVVDINANLGEVGKKISLEEVLLLSVDGNVTVGAPFVENAVVSADVVFAGKGEKIRVAKFKAKSRYRKVTGFRPLLTTVKITGIGNEKVSTNTGEQPRPSKRGTKKSSKA